MSSVREDARNRVYAAVEAALKNDNMDKENIQEIVEFLEAPWTLSEPVLGYAENLDRKMPALIELRDIRFKHVEETPKPPEKIPPERWTLNVWTALVHADARKLEKFVRECQKGETCFEIIDDLLGRLHKDTEMILNFGLYPRKITASRSTSAAPTPTQAPSTASTPSRAPIASSPPSGKRRANSSAQSTPRKKTAKTPAHSSSNTPLQSSPGLPPANTSLPSPRGQARDKKSRTRAHERDGGRCVVLGSNEPEVIHIVPYASIPHVNDGYAALGSFRRFWPDDVWTGYMDALEEGTSNSDALDSPTNMITMDHVLHHLIDLGQIGLEPISNSSNSVKLRLRFFKASIYHTKIKGPATWKRNPGQSPKDTLQEREEPYRPGVPLEFRLVHNKTQHRVKDGHEFDITTDDPTLLPDVRLLRAQWLIACMANLSGRAGDDEYETLGEPEGDPDQQMAPMADDSGDSVSEYDLDRGKDEDSN